MLMNSARTLDAPDTAYAGPAPERNPVRGSSIEVAALRGWRDRNRFVDLPYRLHRNDPNWVPPLRRDMHRRIDRRPNPFFAACEAGFWPACPPHVPSRPITPRPNPL